MDYAAQLNGRAPVVKFSEIGGSYRNLDYLVLGPFVLETDGMMETEYLYERHKVLEEDYLASSGGERAAAPYFGKAQKNDYYGGDTLAWDDVKYMHGVFLLPNGNAIYATAQRNCVWYAAYYIECERPEDAILTFDHSGCLLFVNGELVYSQPYGRVKGLGKSPRTVAVHLNAGLNLVMFKIRTGFIADGMDLTVKDNTIFPVFARAGGLILTTPTPSSKFYAPAESPKQVFYTNAVALQDMEDGEVTLRSGELTRTFALGPMKRGENRYLRLPVPAGAEAMEVPCTLSLCCGGQRSDRAFTASTIPFHGFEGTEIIYTNFHFDTTYYQEQRVYAYGAIDITRRFMEYFRENPKFKGILSEIDYLHPYYSVFPEDRADLKRMFVEGRAESDCFYNQMNEMTSAPEGFARNMAYGQIYHRDVLGRICSVYSPDDVFGHPNQMSQICRKGGCDSLSWCKGIPGFPPVFRHISPDGSSLLTRKGGVPISAAREYGTNTILAWEDFLSGMTAFPREKDTSWMDEYVPKVIFGLPSDVTGNLNADEQQRIKKTGKAAFPYTSRDMSLYHAGVSLSRMDLKIGNRLGENLLISAEKLALIASVLGAEYPEKALDKAWRQLLCGQHHDSITGTHNEVSFVDLMTGYRESAEMAAEIVRASAAYIAGAVASSGSAPVVLFNTHAFKRTGPAEVELVLEDSFDRFIFTDGKGRKLPAQLLSSAKEDGKVRVRALVTAEVPSFGYTVIYLKKGRTADAVKSRDRIIENEYYRVEVDPAQGGGIVSIFDKKAGREVLKKGEDGPANRIAALKEVHNRLEEPHELYTDGHRMFSSDAPAVIRTVKGEAFERIVAEGRLGQIAKTRQEITLYRGVRRIDFKTYIIDYRGVDDLMTVTFPVDVKGGRAVFDDRYSQAVRCESRGKLDFRTHQHLMFSHCAVYAANQWLDYGPSVTLTARDGEKVSRINLGMTALVRPSDERVTGLAEELMTALSKKCLPVTVYPDGSQSQIGGRIAHFNLDLTNTNTRVVLNLHGVKNQYADKLLGMAGRRDAEAHTAAVKENGYAFLLLTDTDNAWQKPIDVLLVSAKNKTALKKAVKEITGQLAAGETLTLDATVSGEEKTADSYGVAILNTGNLACSVEQGGLLNMMLFHTAEWYGSTDRIHPAGFLPEKKTHAFSYALVPHEGDYRSAGIIREGLAFNDPILACAGYEKLEGAYLPESKSFLQTSDNIVVTAVKASGYPSAAMRTGGEDAAARGLTVRWYEPFGRTGRGMIRTDLGAVSADAVNMLEEEPQPLPFSGGGIRFPVTPYTIDTARFELKAPSRRLPSRPLGAQREIVQPVFLRSWEHDAGTMPIGFMAVAGAIGRRLQYPDDLRVVTQVSMANNRGDSRAKGVMRLVLPEGFSAGAAEFAYDVEPGGCAIFPLEIRKPAPEAKGIVRLFYEDDGQTFTDILEIGCFEPGLLIELLENEVLCTVSNDTAEALSGELALASPVETWSVGGLNPVSLLDIGPRTVKVEVAPHNNVQLRFPIRQAGDVLCAFWAVAKLMVNGRIYFKYVDRQGPDHHWDTLKYYGYGVPKGQDWYETYINWDK